MMKNHNCKICGAVFMGGPRATYCPVCRAEIIRQRDRDRKRNGPSRKLGSTDICAVCGKTYTVTSGMQRYCPDCAIDAIRAIDRAQGREYYQANKEWLKPVRNQRRRKTIVCVICGKEFPANGKPTVTCSPECHAVRKKEWQKRGDEKRKRKRNKKADCD